MKKIFIFIGLVLSVSLSGQVNIGVISAQKRVTASPLLTGLVSVWEFDEESGSGTDIIAGNTAVNTNVTLNESGKINKAYLYNGTTSVTALTSAITTGTTYTIAMWLYWDNTQSATYGTLLVNSGTGNGLYVHQTNDYINFYQGGDKFGDAAVTSGAWVQLVFSVSSGSATIYLNNVESGTLTGINTNDLRYMGRVGSDIYKGKIDAVRYWNVALDATLVELLYTKENAGTTYPW